MRVKPGQHLSREGVALARRIGEKIGPFAYVLTSTLPRAIETAIAMGFATDEENELLSGTEMNDEVEREVQWPAGFAKYAEAVKRGGAAARYARQLADLLRKTVLRVAEGENALVVSHGGVLELGVVAALPDYDFSRFGDECDYCEGVRLHFDGQRFVKGEILRVKQD